MWKHTKWKEKDLTSPPSHVKKKNIKGSHSVILRKRSPERDRELLLCGQTGYNSHPTLFGPSFLLTLSHPSPLRLPTRQPLACHPSAAALLSSLAVFLTLSSSLATAVFGWEKSCGHFAGTAVGRARPCSWVMAEPQDRVGHSIAPGWQLLHPPLVTAWDRGAAPTPTLSPCSSGWLTKGCSFRFFGNAYFPWPTAGLYPTEKPLRHHQCGNPVVGT